MTWCLGIINRDKIIRTASFTTPPPFPPLSLNTLHPSNPFKKKAIVSSNCFLSVTSIVTDWKMAFVSLNSLRVPTAASALLDMERTALAVTKLCCNTDRRVVSTDAKSIEASLFVSDTSVFNLIVGNLVLESDDIKVGVENDDV